MPNNEVIKTVLQNVHPLTIPNGLSAHATNLNVLRRHPLMDVKFIPVFGVANDVTANLNVLADAQYTWVRHYNSGSRNYQASDLMFYELGITSLYLFICMCYKILGFVGLYSYKHRDLPKLLATAMNVDLADITSHQEDMKKWVKNCVARLASYVLPKDIQVLETWFEKCLVIYLDDYNESTTPQFINFSPQFFYKLDWENVLLEPFELSKDSNGLITFKTLQNDFDTLLLAVMNNDDIGTISGDLLKAYKDNLYTLDSTGLDDFELPIVRTTNEQMAYITNMDVIYPRNPDGNFNTWTYYQDGDGIINFNPSCAVAIIDADYVASTDVLTIGEVNMMAKQFISASHGNETLITFLSSDVSEEELYEAISSKVSYAVDQYTSVDKYGGRYFVYCKMKALGSEVISGVKYYNLDSFNSFEVSESGGIQCNYYFNVTTFDTVDAEAVVGQLFTLLSKDRDVFKVTSCVNQFGDGPKPVFIQVLIKLDDHGLVEEVNYSYTSINEYIDAVKTWSCYDDTLGICDTHVVMHDMTVTAPELEYSLKRMEWENLVQDLWFKVHGR